MDDLIKKAELLFEARDAAGSGTLPASELADLLTTLQGEAPSPTDLAYLVGEITENNDAKLTVDEFVLIYKARIAAEPARLPTLPTLELRSYGRIRFLVTNATGNIGFLVARALAENPQVS